MPTEQQAPASDEAMPFIPMTPVSSSQIAAIGYDSASKILAVSFTRGAGAIYHYPNVEAKTHADFIGAESIGRYFGKHIKALPFIPPKPAAKSTTTLNPHAAWPFPSAVRLTRSDFTRLTNDDKKVKRLNTKSPIAAAIDAVKYKHG